MSFVTQKEWKTIRIIECSSGVFTVLLYFFKLSYLTSSFSFLGKCSKNTCHKYARCISLPFMERALCACQTCTEEPYALVCGDNGMTYASECHMQREMCLEKKEITLIKRGACGKFFFLNFSANLVSFLSIIIFKDYS